MAESKVNWATVETWQRVAAAIIATGIKIDLHAAAANFGVSYNSFEGGLRKVKGEARAMEKGTGTTSAPQIKSRPPSKKSKSVLDTTRTGRIAKKQQPKKHTNTNIKMEVTSDSDGDDNDNDSNKSIVVSDDPDKRNDDAFKAGIYFDEV